MSLRYMMSRVGLRAAQAARSVKDRAQQQSASSMARTGRAAPQTAESGGTARAGSAAMARKAEEEMRRAKQEESLRTVMFLSMWGPNT